MDLQCPIPIDRYPVVTLAHGGGGRLMQQLIGEMFVAALDNGWLKERADGARLARPSGDVVISTDGFVVKPFIFPGGDIGSLSVHGTVNDVAMMGARALYLSASWILEEGLPMPTLWSLVCSMADAARDCGVSVVTGDTKVVERGSGDGVFISTTGIGEVMTPTVLSPNQVGPGDVAVVSGDVGRHGIAVMAARNQLGLSSDLESDAGPLLDQVTAMLEAGITPHCLRDLTRGGLTAVLHEIASASHCTVRIEEARVPVHPNVKGACELLGLNPLSVACEGRFVAFVPPDQVARSLETLSTTGTEPAVIGEVVTRTNTAVECVTSLGVRRALDLPAGEQLPRIC